MAVGEAFAHQRVEMYVEVFAGRVGVQPGRGEERGVRERPALGTGALPGDGFAADLEAQLFSTDLSVVKSL